jgi:hypothetical protein
MYVLHRKFNSFVMLQILHWYISLHGVISWKTWVLVNITVRTSNPSCAKVTSSSIFQWQGTTLYIAILLYGTPMPYTKQNTFSLKSIARYIATNLKHPVMVTPPFCPTCTILNAPVQRTLTSVSRAACWVASRSPVSVRRTARLYGGVCCKLFWLKCCALVFATVTVL